MWTVIASLVLPPLVGYVLDRWKYARDIFNAGKVLVPHMPKGTPRDIAEQAVIAANQAEVERAVKQMEQAQREHAARMAVIESGAGNFGDLYKPDGTPR